ncbi:MAG: hypothetical protein VKN83_08750 [Cyanobacteriota bacterium]|nr:hypothetical protein [Cyanobacteriota bacterium]
MDDITAAYARELQTAISGIEIRTPEHPADRAQQHRIERMAVWMIAATSAFVALLIVFSPSRPVPEKRLDWSTGILQLVLERSCWFCIAAIAMSVLSSQGADRESDSNTRWPPEPSAARHVNAEDIRGWTDFFRDGPTVSEDVLVERGSQEQSEREPL